MPLWPCHRCFWKYLGRQPMPRKAPPKICSDGTVLGIFSADDGYGIATDRLGQVWVANYGSGCVYRFLNDGRSMGCIPSERLSKCPWCRS